MVIKLTKDQFDRLSYINTDDPNDIEFMKSFGIDFNQGFIDIEVDGKLHKMNTSKGDFGTILLKPNKGQMAKFDQRFPKERTKKINIPDSEPIKLTQDEFDRIHNLETKDPDDIKFMKSKGIDFWQGEPPYYDINIEIDGEPKVMTTRRDDFGTLLREMKYLKTFEGYVEQPTEEEMEDIAFIKKKQEEEWQQAQEEKQKNKE